MTKPVIGIAMLCLWATAAPAFSDDAPRLKAGLQDDGSWVVLIRPLTVDPHNVWEYTQKQGITDAGGAVDGAVWNQKDPAPGCQGLRMSYEAAYGMIPFSRAEYEANPGYRHDAALELMFGRMRPTTIVRQNTPYFTRYPDDFRFNVYPYPSFRTYNNFNYQPQYPFYAY